MNSWSLVIPFNPQSAPRPSFTIRNVTKTIKGRKVKKRTIIPYNETKYSNYLNAIYAYINKLGMYDDNFTHIINAKYGVIADIVFYISPGDHVKKVNKITYTNAPDIDNLIKASLDGIFNNLTVRDSRVVGLRALKLNELDNPRTEITLSGLFDVDEDSSDHSQCDNALTIIDDKLAQSQIVWTTTFPFNPMATPRPVGRVDIDKRNRKKKAKINSFNPTKYTNYLNSIKKYLMDNDLYNSKLKRVVSAKNGIIANMNFYCEVPKSQKNILKITKSTRPDIDNLMKAAIDGIFNNLKEDDSRIVGVQAFKFNVFAEQAHTDISLIGLDDVEDEVS